LEVIYAAAQILNILLWNLLHKYQIISLKTG
jgi:hypothetical protein